MADLDLSSIVVTDNTATGQFEARVPGGPAVTAYRLAGDTITFTHTEVPEALEGQGVAAKLVHEALESARSRGLKVVPQCRYVAAYIKRHPEYQPLVAPDGNA